MSIKKTIILAIIVLIFGSYCYFFELKGEGNKESKPDERKNVFNFNKSEVEQIKLADSFQTFSLIKKEEEWWISEPAKGKADAKAVNSYINALADIIEVMVVEEGPPDLSIFGLDNPWLKVGFKLREEPDFNTIYLGNANPNHTSIYAKIEGLSPVFLIGNFYQEGLSRGVDSFRSKN